jgi:hypothetical protein
MPFLRIRDAFHRRGKTIDQESGMVPVFLQRAGGQKMPRVALKGQAPDFTLNDFHGSPVHLVDFRDKKHVVLVFNRGFT